MAFTRGYFWFPGVGVLRNLTDEVTNRLWEYFNAEPSTRDNPELPLEEHCDCEEPNTISDSESDCEVSLKCQNNISIKQTNNEKERNQHVIKQQRQINKRAHNQKNKK